MTQKRIRRAEFFLYLPAWHKKFTLTSCALAISLILLGLLVAYLQSENIITKNNAPLFCYTTGIFIQGAALSFISYQIIRHNIKRKKLGQNSFGLNKHGSAEGGSYWFNQIINAFYLLFGISMTVAAVGAFIFLLS